MLFPTKQSPNRLEIASGYRPRNDITKMETPMPVIDQATFEELKQMSGEDFINELIDAFLDEAPTMIQNMQSALETRDVESFRRNAHSMKSNANTFGATELGALAKELEFMAKENDLEIGNRLEVLIEAYGKAAEEMKGMRT
jgi:HPt (histidine-containing phosphotransfer) domain-containing protein